MIPNPIRTIQRLKRKQNDGHEIPVIDATNLETHADRYWDTHEPSNTEIFATLMAADARPVDALDYFMIEVECVEPSLWADHRNVSLPQVFNNVERAQGCLEATA